MDGNFKDSVFSILVILLNVLDMLYFSKIRLFEFIDINMDLGFILFKMMFRLFSISFVVVLVILWLSVFNVGKYFFKLKNLIIELLIKIIFWLKRFIILFLL